MLTLIKNQFTGSKIDDKADGLEASIVEALLAAKKPLIVTGISLYNEAIIESAANIAYALKDQGKDAGIFLVVPEANSIGMTILADQFLEDAFENTCTDIHETAILIENDLYQRMDKASTDKFFKGFKNTIVLDYLDNATVQNATYVLPAGTFAEADGTIINNEGRAQRFYQVHIPKNDVRSSWKWLQEILSDNNPLQKKNLDEIIDNLIEVYPELQAIKLIAPSVDFREGTQKIPREPQGYSGRTAMNAHVDVSELMPAIDMDAPLSFTMEGYAGLPLAALTPFYWSPGWNSVQALNKYQVEVGGPLKGGNPGKKVFEPLENSNVEYFNTMPTTFSPKEGEWLVLPLYHIFGSDELSALSPGMAERVPQPYIAINNKDAMQAGITEGILLEVFFNGQVHRLPAKLNGGLPEGIAGLPKGLEQTAGVHYPFWTTLNKVK
jgi:NADH-quinone oxidoreductase subunit G